VLIRRGVSATPQPLDQLSSQSAAVVSAGVLQGSGSRATGEGALRSNRHGFEREVRSAAAPTRSCGFLEREAEQI